MLLLKPTFETFSRVICMFVCTALSFFIFGLRAFNVSSDKPPYEPAHIEEWQYRSAGGLLVNMSIAIGAVVVALLFIDALFAALKSSYLQSLEEVHEVSELEGTFLYKVNSVMLALENWANLAKHSVPDNACRISSLFTEVIFYSCVVTWFVQVTGTTMRVFGSDFARDVGIIITSSYGLGWIIHYVAVTTYIFGKRYIII